MARWHADPALAHLTLTPGRRSPLDPAELQPQLAAIRSAGYQGVVTAAVARSDQAVFVDAGFRVVERLHVLRHDLGGPLGRDSMGRGPAGQGPMPTRRARRRDRQAILELDWVAFTPFWQLDDNTLTDALTATRTVRWRVMDSSEGRLAGYGICGLSGARGYVQRLAVHPHHQGRGLGTSLLADGLRWLARRGAQDALVNTQVDNHRSLRLYLRSGFVPQPGGLAVLRLDFDAPRGNLPKLGIVRRR